MRYDPKRKRISLVSYYSKQFQTPEDTGTESNKQTICEIAEDHLSCGHLKTIREMKIRQQEAAKKIQALWRGFRTRKIIDARDTITPEIMKCVS